MKNIIAIIFMVVIDLYGADYCGYCRMAEHLLNKKGLKYIKHDITTSKTMRTELYQKTGRTTIPQIFINDKHIGGYDDLVKLDQSGKLDKITKG